METQMQSDDKDSLARLINDVEQAAEAKICACEYFGRQESVDKCAGCRARGNRCYEEAFNDIASRLHALMPHDKDGREIKAGDVLAEHCREQGTGYFIKGFRVVPTTSCNVCITHAPTLRVMQPDSWERLKEDLGLTCCTYFDDGNVTEGCNGCRAEELGGNMGGDCDKLMFDDIISRAKALAGVEQ